MKTKRYEVGHAEGDCVTTYHFNDEKIACKYAQDCAKLDNEEFYCRDMRPKPRTVYYSRYAPDGTFYHVVFYGWAYEYKYPAVKDYNPQANA